MACWLRKSATLIAIYSIAVQALIWGFAPPGHSGFDPFAIICTADSSGDHQPAPAQHRSNCDACLAACSGSPALVSASAAFALVFFTDGPARPMFFAEPVALQPRHQLHVARAPPIPS